MTASAGAADGNRRCSFGLVMRLVNQLPIQPRYFFGGVTGSGEVTNLSRVSVGVSNVGGNVMYMEQGFR